MDFISLPAFCINLDARPDRWESVRNQFGGLDWEVKRVSASMYWFLFQRLEKNV